MFSGYYVDGTILCEFCATQAEIDECKCVDNEETDCPQHCEECARPIKYTLTTDGINYVVEYLQEAIDRQEYNSKETRTGDPNNYYRGMPIWSVVYDWAVDLKSYWLNETQQAVLDEFFDKFTEMKNPNCDDYHCTKKDG